MNRLKISVLVMLALLVLGCKSGPSIEPDQVEACGYDTLINFTTNKALEVVEAGFSAGEGYDEVWIRDFNTFIELAAEVFEPAVLKENLLIFFRMQGADGNIIDGFTPREQVGDLEYAYIYTDREPRYAGHKNTVETDQETSLIQAVYKYILATGDSSILNVNVGDTSVTERMEEALLFLMNNRYSKEYGLLWGATTADWGDVQPEHPWGVFLTEDTHYAIDIYDNAMFIVALENYMEMVPAKRATWKPVRDSIFSNTRKHLWDDKAQKFIPHIYLDDSPFPEDFNEDRVFYHGGTAVAIEAGLLSDEEILTSLDKMIDNVQETGAGSIGLTLYPPYPAGSFENKSMVPFGYQNGGDWTWFGGRMIQQLIRYGFVEEACEQLRPMLERVKEYDGFYEWYTINNEPRGSGTFRGSAGVLYKAIQMLKESEDGK